MSNSTVPQNKKFSWKNSLRLFGTGITMGAADIVPGVSGGTVAFLLGIYEELIYSIKLITGDVLKLFLKGKFKAGWKLIPFQFLVPLFLGIGIALVSLARVISHLLVASPTFVWSFFFGLVLASVFVVRKRVVTWDVHDYVATLITAVLAFILVGVVPVETSESPIMLFLSGAIAICAMILPGISGSFLLVIMGKYEQILGAVTNFEVGKLLIFGAGAVVGLALFSRLLSYLFAKHHDLIIAILIGFMLGSLRKIWPWKEVLMTRVNSHGEIVPLVEKNILPSSFDLAFVMCLVLMVIGFVCILLLDRFQVTKEHTQDIKDRDFREEHKEAIESQDSHQM